MEYVTLPLHYIELSFIVHNLLFLLWYHTVILLGNHFSFEQSVLCSGRVAIFVTPMPLHWRHKTLNYVLQLTTAYLLLQKKINWKKYAACFILHRQATGKFYWDFCSSDEIIRSTTIYCQVSSCLQRILLAISKKSILMLMAGKFSMSKWLILINE